jgi:hypothetical protein
MGIFGGSPEKHTGIFGDNYSIIHGDLWWIAGEAHKKPKAL